MKCPNCSKDNPDDSRFCGWCGRSLVEPPTTPPTATTRYIHPTGSLDFLPGQHFGPRYQIVEEIGRGGMGVVYKAIDRELDRVVALKMIRHELSTDPEMVGQFKRELILASEISHDNVIRIHDLGEARGIKYISMKYIDGTSLKDLINATGRLTVEKAIGIAGQICAALTAAHRKGVIHRDLKPQNIMIDRAGDAHVMDFGIATSLVSTETVAKGRIFGTPGYISPEQAQGKAGDERSDIYGLGCIIYEMVTGRKPFESETAEGLLRQHIAKPAPAPSDADPRLPDRLDAIVAKAMEKDPDRRYRSAAALCEALESVATVPGDTRKSPGGARGGSQEELSIAVLPFRDMSPEKDQEYFCDGMAEEIINALVGIEGLRVAALTSALQFKNKALDIRNVGGQLNVGAVLEGSVRKAGNRLRVTAQLVSVDDGYHVWSERYDRDMEDVFAIQDDISEAIVRALEPKLAVKKRRPTARRSTDLEAYNLYLRGRYHWNRRMPEDIKKAIECFEKALSLDPDYALAHAGLADAYILGSDTASEEIYTKARVAARRALELDDTLAEPYTTLAWVACNADFAWDEAERLYKKSISLNPSYATAHQWYALTLASQRRFEEALREVEIAKEVDPLSLIIRIATGWILQCAGQTERAMEEIKGALDMDPGFAPAHSVLSGLYADKGMYDEAVEELAVVLQSLGRRESAVVIRNTFKESGYDGVREVMVRELLDGKLFHEGCKSEAATYLTELGEIDRALDLLEQAVGDREQEIITVGMMPRLDPLRSHPRFKALLRKMNLPVD